MQALPAAAGRLGLRVPITVDARRAVGTLALSGLVASGLLVAAGAAGEPSSFVPARKGGEPAWLHEPLSSLHLGLGPEGVVLAIFAMWAFYAVTMAFSDAIPARRALGAIVTLHLVFLLGPPLLSTDVFNYVEYGRLGVLHHLNPYTYSPAEVPGDAAFGFIGWPNATTVYGPVFTLGSYATVPLGVGGALWAFKTVMVAASLGCVALVWKAAERLGRPPLEAAMFFGLNPLLLVLAVGGAHNDMLMLFLALAGIVLVLGGRERAGGLAVVGGAAIKASTAILLPYMLVGAHRRGRFLVGALAGAAGRRRSGRSPSTPRSCRSWTRSAGSRTTARVTACRGRSARSWARPSAATRSGSSCRPCSRWRWRSRSGAPTATATGSWPRAGARSRCCSRPRGCCPGTWSGCCRSRP